MNDLDLIKIQEIKDNEDGSVTVIFEEIPQELKNSLVKRLKWTSWSDEKFSILVNQAIMNLVSETERTHK